MMPHPLTNFKTQKHYDNKPKFNGVYSRNNLSKIKDGTYIIHLNEYQSIGNHWIPLYVNAKIVIFFNSLGVEHISKEIKDLKKLYCVNCSVYRKFGKPKILYLLKNKKTVFSIICSTYKNGYEKVFKEKESIEILKLGGLINNM